MNFSNNKNNKIEISKDESRYRVKNRLESWKRTASEFTDQHLAKLKQIMLLVFKEEKPIFKIDKEKRAFTAQSKVKSHYSDDIRTGLAIELAIIGTFNHLMVNCSSGLRESFAKDVILDLFKGMTWRRLASLDPVLPFIAEASPDVFLSEMISLTRNKTIIQQLEKDEGNNWFYRESHFVGLSRALETLAWEPEYLNTVISIAANLSLIDETDSNLHPRPKDIFFGIFWPWKPQTLSSDDKLIASANFLSLQNKRLAWDILSDSIDRQMGAYHRIPRVRKRNNVEYNPKDPDFNRGIRLIHSYANLLLEIVESDVSFVPKMVHDIHLFRDASFEERALTILTSNIVLEKNDEFKEPLWASLQKFCINNRVHNDMNWSFEEEKLSKIDNAIRLLEPKSPFFRVKHFFDNKPSDWYESKDYTAEICKFEEKRKDTVNSIYSRYGLNGVIELSQQVDNSTLIGNILSNDLKIKFDKKTILSLLDDPRKKTQDLIFGYLYHAYNLWGNQWLSTFRNVKWSVTQKTSFMICLPLLSSVCQFAETWLGENESLFWKDYRPPIVPQEDKNRIFVIKKSLKYNRPDIAFGIFSWLRFNKENIDFDFCTTTLLELAKTDYIKKFDHWEITQLIVNLQSMQKSDKQKNKLMQVEFYYLPLLDSNLHKTLSPATLYSALAEDPKFFHQVITYAYKSEIPDKTLHVNEDLSKNAFKLMYQWDVMPGVVSDTLDYDAFMNWYKEAIELCRKTGHLRVAQTHIGETLYKTPKDSSGFWIDKRIAALLDEEENDLLRRGYHCAAFNSRGVRVVDFSGKREHAAAEEQNKKADDLEKNGFTNFAKVFRDLARIYEEEAESAIKDGERFKRQDTDEL